MGGIQYRESSGSKDRDVAEALLRQCLAGKSTSQLRLMEFMGPQRLTLGDALQELDHALPEWMQA